LVLIPGKNIIIRLEQGKPPVIINGPILKSLTLRRMLPYWISKGRIILINWRKASVCCIVNGINDPK